VPNSFFNNKKSERTFCLNEVLWNKKISNVLSRPS